MSTMNMTIDDAPPRIISAAKLAEEIAASKGLSVDVWMRQAVEVERRRWHRTQQRRVRRAGGNTTRCGIQVEKLYSV